MTSENSDRWLDLALSASRHAGVEPGAPQIIATWDQPYCANAVYRLGGQRILKIFGPEAERQFHIERSVLHTLADQNTIPAPRILALGERRQAPPYLILSEVAGSTAEDVWDDIARSEQLSLAGEFGAITAAIHRLPQAELAAVERQFQGKAFHIERCRPLRLTEIKELASLSTAQRDALLRFVLEEAPQHLASLNRLTHYDLAHNHIYLNRKARRWQVSGLIDWAEAVLGPPEWDVVYLWSWTFSGDREAMRACLERLYPDGRRPARFARRCLAALFYTSSMRLLWPRYLKRGVKQRSIIRDLTAFLFPAALFGPPD